MVDSQEIREDFALRLSQALDRMQAVRSGRGRNVDLHAALKSRGVDTTTQATSKWLRGESMPEKDNMRHLASWLCVPVQWLEYGEGQMVPDMRNPDGSLNLDKPWDDLGSSHLNVAPAQESHRKDKEYPLISWVAAGCWQESCDNFSPGDAEQWIASDANAGPHGYWLTVKGPSMQPTFMPGSRILVRPEGFDLVSGKFYIAKLMDAGETTFKQYIRDGGIGFLQPLNSAFPIMQITDNVQIIGQVVDGRLPPIF